MLQEIYDAWNKLAGSFSGHVDTYTVKVFTKWSKMGRPPTNEEIDKAFFPLMAGEPCVFGTVPEEQKKELVAHAKAMKKPNTVLS